MIHLSLRGDHYQMGVEQGRRFRACGVAFPLRLDEFQRAHGARSEGILREVFPEVCAEIRGVSDAMGVDYASVAAWMLCMGCCMYNLEENVPAEVRGCTAFACARNGRTIYGRNSDLPPYLKRGGKSELYAPAGGNRFHLATSSFINGEEGLNEHGLAVAMTFVMTRPGEIRPGLNACFVVRYLLERAESAARARTLLMELPVASNCNILLADRGGEMAVVECAPGAKRVRTALRAGDGALVCAVNRFESEEMRTAGAPGADDCDSGARYAVATRRLSAPVEGDPVEEAQRLLRGEYGFMCQYDDRPDIETAWSSVFDLNRLMIHRAEGDPRSAAFRADCGLRELLRA